MRKLNDKELLEVGDWIVSEHSLYGKNKYPITRVTKTMAICVKPRFKDNPKDTFTTRFPRIYSDLGYQSIPYNTWNSTSFIAYTERE